MTTIHAQAERKRQDRSVCRAEKRLCRARMLRVRGLIHPTSAVCATTDTARGEKRLPSEQNQAILKSSGRPLGECRFTTPDPDLVAAAPNPACACPWRGRWFPVLLAWPATALDAGRDVRHHDCGGCGPAGSGPGAHPPASGCGDRRHAGGAVRTRDSGADAGLGCDIVPAGAVRSGLCRHCGALLPCGRPLQLGHRLFRGHARGARRNGRDWRGAGRGCATGGSGPQPAHRGHHRAGGLVVPGDRRLCGGPVHRGGWPAAAGGGCSPAAGQRRVRQPCGAGAASACASLSGADDLFGGAAHGRAGRGIAAGRAGECGADHPWHCDRLPLYPASA